MIKRKTIQCALVSDTVKKLKCHPTADEVYDEIIKEHPSVSRTTVYRNLQRLCETGDLLKIEVPDAADRFDHNCRYHYHIECTECGSIADIDMDYMADLYGRIKDTYGFSVTGYELIFKGICPRCQNKPQAK